MTTEESPQLPAPPPVLVVDDEPHICSFIEMALLDEGYDVLVARDGQAALGMLGTQQPSVILLDLQMPQMDGRQMVAAYRAMPGPHAPIIVMTASRIPEETAAVLGVEGVLRKPFDVEALLQIVAGYVRSEN